MPANEMLNPVYMLHPSFRRFSCLSLATHSSLPQFKPKTTYKENPNSILSRRLQVARLPLFYPSNVRSMHASPRFPTHKFARIICYHILVCRASRKLWANQKDSFRTTSCSHFHSRFHLHCPYYHYRFRFRLCFHLYFPRA